MFASKIHIQESDCLKKRSDFLRLQSTGVRWTSKGFTLQVAPSTPQAQKKYRFGFTVSKKISKKAVIRNRVRRQFRALLWEILPQHAVAGYDYVLIARHDAVGYKYEQMKKDLIWCLRRLALPVLEPVIEA